MVIEENLLIAVGADVIRLRKNELLFKEKSVPAYYYQIIKGKIKLTNSKVEDKEFIQSFRLQGECVGGIFLFSTYSYPMSAVAMEDCTILRLNRQMLISLLKDDFEIQLNFFRYVAERLHFNYILLNSLKSDNTANRLLTLLDYLKDSYHHRERYSYQIPYTRKEISSMIGIRIEIVIRTIKKMEKEGILKIEKGKIFY